MGVDGGLDKVEDMCRNAIKVISGNFPNQTSGRLRLLVRIPEWISSY